MCRPSRLDPCPRSGISSARLSSDANSHGSRVRVLVWITRLRGEAGSEAVAEEPASPSEAVTDPPHASAIGLDRPERLPFAREHNLQLNELARGRNGK